MESRRPTPPAIRSRRKITRHIIRREGLPTVGLIHILRQKFSAPEDLLSCTEATAKAAIQHHKAKQVLERRSTLTAPETRRRKTTL